MFLWAPYVGARWVLVNTEYGMTYAHTVTALHILWCVFWYVDVSENSGTPKSSNSSRVFHYQASILGYPYFWKHPYVSSPLLDFFIWKGTTLPVVPRLFFSGFVGSWIQLFSNWKQLLWRILKQVEPCKPMWSCRAGTFKHLSGSADKFPGYSTSTSIMVLYSVFLLMKLFKPRRSSKQRLCVLGI